MRVNQSSKMNVGGVAYTVIRRAKTGLYEAFIDKNIVVDVGVNHALNSLFGEASQISNWYMGFLNNYTPVAGSTMANFGHATNEFVDYDEAARQAYTPNAAATSKSITNSSSPVVITSSSDSNVVYGFFTCSSATKNEVASTALSGLLFSSSKSLDTGDTLTVVYTFGGADDGV